MPKQSAGIVLYKIVNGEAMFFLVHPGGPFFKNRDLGSWTIPKGEYPDDEEPLTAAIREFAEETGLALSGDFIELAPVTQKGGKVVAAWAIAGDIDITQLVSNTFQIEWPPRSGKMQSFPEIDKGAWFDYDTAIEKINPAQAALLQELKNKL
jgi:predicted NUDIX family NTP pyrophosphohydrolase